ncbi:MAG: response regulator [Janthinobacterium lividum]
MMTARGEMAGRRVLVVEDDYFIAKGLVRHLRAAGVEVVGPAATVADALDLVRAGPLDGAVLDINLQGELAFAVADALVERGVPFVFTTGYSADVIPERYTGIVRCEKPVDPGVLTTALFGSAA